MITRLRRLAARLRLSLADHRIERAERDYRRAIECGNTPAARRHADRANTLSFRRMALLRHIRTLGAAR